MRIYSAIAKSIKRYTDNTLDIKRFSVLSQKLNLYIIGICLLIPAIWFNGFDENFIEKRTQVFNYKERIRAQYDKLAAGYEERRRLGISDAKLRSYDEFYQGQLNRYHFRFGFVYGSMAITALPWLLILFWPAGAPIRVDRKSGLIYTRQWFRFYAARLDQIQPECKDFSAALERVGGPLIISLYRHGKVYNKDGQLNRGMRIRIGCYIPPDLSHNRDILRCIEKFMKHEADIPNGLKPKKGWLEWSFAPPHKLAKQEKLDKKINHWIEKEKAIN